MFGGFYYRGFFFKCTIISITVEVYVLGAPLRKNPNKRNENQIFLAIPGAYFTLPQVVDINQCGSTERLCQVCPVPFLQKSYGGEFKDRIVGRRKEWEMDRECEKRGYPSLRTKISLVLAFNIVHTELTFILVSLGTLFKLAPASRFHQVMISPKYLQLGTSFALILWFSSN